MLEEQKHPKNRKQRRTAAKQQRVQLKKLTKELEVKARRAFEKLKKRQAFSSEEAVKEYAF